MRKEATDKMEAKLDRAARMVHIAMDFTLYFSASRGQHVVCDETNYESAMLWAANDLSPIKGNRCHDSSKMASGSMLCL